MNKIVNTDRLSPAQASSVWEPSLGACEATVEVHNLHCAPSPAFALILPAFRLPPNCLTALIGPNGSGKTTLLSCVLGSRPAGHGTVQLFGHPVRQLPVAKRARIGVQLQDVGFNEQYKVQDIVKLHRLVYAASDPAIFDAFRIAELDAKRFGALSSGEKQRLQLAMAMAHRPELMIFDEPSSNLDAYFEGVFCDLLTRARHDGASSIFITHSPRVVAISNQILFLRDGRVEHQGPQRELISKLFGPVGCLFAGNSAAQSHVQSALAAVPGVRFRLTRDGLQAFGDAPLRRAAIEAAAQVELERFALWSPDAADLMQEVKND